MQTTNPSTIATVSSKLRAVAKELGEHLLERESVIEGIMLGLIAKQHVLLVGTPGTGKSMLARAVAERLTGERHFEILLTKFTTPEEVFGPISLTGLQQDRYTRLLDGRLATAHTAFVDEVGKASSAILNALLSLMADGVFHDDGRALSCPLISVVGASNELPDGDELAALYDRFLLRFEVKPLSDGGFSRLIGSQTPTISAPTTIDLAELETLHAAMPLVTVPPTITTALVKLRGELAQHGLVASDRRWRASLSALRASALFNGRSTVCEDDLDLLAHILWGRPEDQGAIAKAVAKVGNPLRARLTELTDQAVEIHEEATKHFATGEQDAVQKAAMHSNSKLKAILHELRHLHESHTGQDTSRIEEAVEKVKGLNADIVRRGFGL